MAKFYGAIGFVKSEEISPAIWEDRATERRYYGEVLRNRRRYENGQWLHDNLNVSNQISIIADAYAEQNFFAMRYIKWMGSLWEISDVEVQRPRLILTIGGLYNGPCAEASIGLCGRPRE